MRSVTVAALATCALLGCSRSGTDKAPRYTTAAVDRGPIVARVTATGTLSALVTVQVGAQVSGRIDALNADFNSQVKKGQVLATMDPELFNAALAQARANERAAQGNLARAVAQAADSQRKFTRQKQLFEQKLIAQADLDAATAELEVNTANIQAAEGSVAQARASRQQAEVNLTYTTIRSPIDGTVISRAVDVGQTVAASLSAPTLFTIAENLSKMQVDTNVAEADVGKLKEGLEASFTVDAFSGRPFRGVIRQIRFAPQVLQNVVTYDAVIDVDNGELLLRPGMTATVSFVWARVDDALRVPNAAFRFRPDDAAGRRAGRPDAGAAMAGAPATGGALAAVAPNAGEGRGPRAEGATGPGEDRGRGDGGRGGRGREGRTFGRSEPTERTLYVLKDGAPVATLVRVGVSDGSTTEVVSGLDEGMAVITEKQGEPGARPPSGTPPGQAPGMGGGLRRVF